MPAGSGPMVNSVSNVVLPANTTENVLCTIPPSNWNIPGALGLLVSFAVVITGAAAGTLTFRIRQGNSAAGTQVGPSIPVTVSNGAVLTPASEFQDTSAFAIGVQQGAQYVLTYQQSANSLGTVNSGLIELETIAPLS